MACNNTPNSDRQEESNDVTPIQQSQEDTCRHIACND